MTRQTLRIAVAGAGLIGRVHAAALVDNIDTVPWAIVDPAPGATGFAELIGVPCHASLDELFTSGRPDAVIVATPNALHVGHATRCLDEGIPILLEKPVAPSVREAEALLAHPRAASVLVGHHRTHGAILRRAREVIQSGALGRLVAIAGSALFYKPDTYFEEAAWRSRPGGGPILINLIHEVHSLRLLCGEITAVQAQSSNATRGHEVEDSTAILLRFANGALGTFLLSDAAASARSWEQTSGENPAYARIEDEDCYVVAGTRGSLSIPTMRLTRYAKDRSPSWWAPFERESLGIEGDDPIARQLEHFVQLIRGEVQPLVSLADGIANLRVVEAVVRAAETGTLVEV